jgi:hypothetical protein
MSGHLIGEAEQAIAGIKAFFQTEKTQPEFYEFFPSRPPPPRALCKNS